MVARKLRTLTTTWPSSVRHLAVLRNFPLRRIVWADKRRHGCEDGRLLAPRTAPSTLTSFTQWGRSLRHVSTVRLLGWPVGTVLPMVAQPGHDKWGATQRSGNRRWQSASPLHWGRPPMSRGSQGYDWRAEFASPGGEAIRRYLDGDLPSGRSRRTPDSAWRPRAPGYRYVCGARHPHTRCARRRRL